MTTITLVLHNIRSTHNVGSIFRTAEGFGVAKIICSGYTPYPSLANDRRLPHIKKKLTEQIHKTALGAETMVDFNYIEDINDWLKSCSLPIFALEQTPDSLVISSFKPPEALVLVIGEEVNGVPPEILQLCQASLEIPMQGQKESFNVSVAIGVALYALAVN